MELLDGKCKQDFEDWFIEQNQYFMEYINVRNGVKIFSPYFYSMPFAMKWGVYLEFFDSIGDFYISIQVTSDNYFSVYIDKSGSHIMSEYMIYPGRQQAQTEAIKKAKEIFNQAK